MAINKPRKAVITSVSIVDGEVRCDLEDLHQNNIPYKNIQVEQPTTGKIVVPEVGTVAVLRPMYGNKPIISGFLDLPDSTFSDEGAVEEGAKNGENSIAFTVGENGEKILLERTTDGYDVTIDVSGDVSVAADGTVTVDAQTVKLGGDSGTKLVARKGDAVETSDPLTGTNTGEITGSASNTEAK